MNSLNHFRKLQAQYLPKRIFGSNLNYVKIINQRLQGENHKKEDKFSKFKSELPAHIKRYPNFFHKRTDIIDVELRVKGKIELKDISQKIKVKKEYYKIPCKVKDVKTPMHDFINFKHMSGNEILLNMSNSEFFRPTELINSLYELGLRMNLKVNSEVKDMNIYNHPYIGKTLDITIKRIENFKLNHLIVLSLAFHKLNIKNNEIWSKLEVAFDKILHKIKASEIVFLIDLFNKDSGRGSNEFYTKMLTVLPIHIDKMNITQILQIIRVCLSQNIINERLFKYFIYPKIEKKIPIMKINQYIEVLNILAELGYEEDKIFWLDHILPGIFNYEYSIDQVNSLWEALLRVKVNCTTIDLAKFILLVENLRNNFEVLKNKGEDISTIYLSLDEEFKPVPKRKDQMSRTKIRETEKRLRFQPSLQGLLEKPDENTSSASMEESFKSLLNIKDWNKAKYEMEQNELKKAKILKEEQAELKKKLSEEKKEARKAELTKKEEENTELKKKEKENLATNDIQEKLTSEAVQEVEVVDSIPNSSKSFNKKLLLKKKSKTPDIEI